MHISLHKQSKWWFIVTITVLSVKNFQTYNFGALIILDSFVFKRKYATRKRILRIYICGALVYDSKCTVSSTIPPLARIFLFIVCFSGTPSSCMPILLVKQESQETPKKMSALSKHTYFWYLWAFLSWLQVKFCLELFGHQVASTPLWLKIESLDEIFWRESFL